MAKKPKPISKRSPAEQAAIDKRMAAMRAARDLKKNSEKPAPVKKEPEAKKPEAAASVQKTAGTPETDTNAPTGTPVIKRWTLASLQDFAVLPKDQIEKALYMASVSVRKAHHKGMALESLTYTEQGRIEVKEVPIEIDPLA